MNTPAHLLLGAAVFGGRGSSKVALAALVGAALPDLSLYVMVGVSLSVLNIPPQRVFNELYFSDAWQTVFAIDNSVVIWIALLVGAILWKRAWAVALCGAALLHIALDFPLHHDDGRPHFWPLTWWVFESPISYWDTRHGAGWIGPLEGIAALAAGIWIFVKRPPVWLMIVTAVLLCAELWIVRQWLFFFTDSV